MDLVFYGIQCNLMVLYVGISYEKRHKAVVAFTLHITRASNVFMLGFALLLQADQEASSLD